MTSVTARFVRISWPDGDQATYSPAVVEFPGVDEGSPDEQRSLPGLATMTLSVDFKEVNPAALFLLTGSRSVLGWPRPLPIDGREYRRRVRRR